MMQKIIFGLVISTFLLVWGAVLYEILKPKPQPVYEDKIEAVVDTSEQLLEREDVIGNEVVEIEKEEFVEIPTEINIKVQTELNNKSVPRLDQGIDFGTGISIDDILKNIELIFR